VRTERLISLEAVLAEARAVRAGGASRFCMGAAWRSPKDRDLDSVCTMVEGVGAPGLETCATLGMLTAAQARRLKDAGLDYYNHNLNSSPEFKIIPYAPTRIAWKRSHMCGRPAFMFAAAALSAWAKRARTVAA
jgi:biotin synthase-like enzyme